MTIPSNTGSTGASGASGASGATGEQRSSSVTTSNVTFNGQTGDLQTVTTIVDTVNGVASYTETDTVITDADGNVVDTVISIVAASTGADASVAAEVDLIPSSSASASLVSDIQDLQSQLSCSDLQHLGSMTDYADLFQKAKLYIDTVGDKNIDLVIDTTVIDRFAADAEVYAQMFAEVQVQFQQISTVNDVAVLTKIKHDLQLIADMYSNIKKFHATITATSFLQIPESIKDVSQSLQAVSDTILCTMPYLEYFADNTTILSSDQQLRSQLSAADKNAITAAIGALDTWINMVQSEANVTMNGNAYVQAFKDKIASFSALDSRLVAVTNKVAARLNAWKAGNFA